MSNKMHNVLAEIYLGSFSDNKFVLIGTLSNVKNNHGSFL